MGLHGSRKAAVRHPTILPPLVCGPIIQPGDFTQQPQHEQRRTGYHQVKGRIEREEYAFLAYSRRQRCQYSNSSPCVHLLLNIRQLQVTVAPLNTFSENKLIGISDASHVYRELLDLIHVSPELVRGFPLQLGRAWARGESPRYGQDVSKQEIVGVEVQDIVLDAVKSLSERATEPGWEVMG